MAYTRRVDKWLKVDRLNGIEKMGHRLSKIISVKLDFSLSFSSFCYDLFIAGIKLRMS